jgi:hypothetical protein
MKIYTFKEKQKIKKALRMLKSPNTAINKPMFLPRPHN